MEIDEAFEYIFEELRKSFSKLEDNGLIETFWDENGENSIQPTRKLMEMEKKGTLQEFLKEIFPEDEFMEEEM